MLAVLILTVSLRWSVKCSESVMNLAHPRMTPLLVGSGCPAYFHAPVARGESIMATPPLVCPRVGVFAPAAVSASVFESDASGVPWVNM